MEGTNISVVDTNLSHTLTYYGNGCPVGWDSGAGGSTVACSTRLISDEENELQKNGTLYNFQSITVGTGASLTARNANASDSFCPLGWQLPYSGTDGDYYNQSKSWRYLLTSYNIIDNTSSNWTEMKKYPMTYISSGIYHWIYGKIFGMSNNYDGGFAAYYSATNYSSGEAYRLEKAYPIQTNGKNNGLAARCQLRRRHGGRN